MNWNNATTVSVAFTTLRGTNYVANGSTSSTTQRYSYIDRNINEHSGGLNYHSTGESRPPFSYLRA